MVFSASKQTVIPTVQLKLRQNIKTLTCKMLGLEREREREGQRANIIEYKIELLAAMM
jgi:hypothetical protein